MQAYETGFRHNDTRMLLNPDTDFFRYFIDPNGKSTSSAGKVDEAARAGNAAK
jgi:membrane protease subunit HflC